MRKLTQKLVLSVVTMALVVIALGTSTFAWFTLTNSASVGTFQGQITAGEGIEISLGQTTAQTINYSTETQWYTAMPASIIQDFLNAKYPSFRFDNVTSETGTAFEDQSGGSVTSGYIEFKLYFRSRTPELEIAWNSVVLGGDEDDWAVNSPFFLHANGQTYGVGGAHNTLRVAAWPASRVSVSNGTSTVVYEAPAATSSSYTSFVYNSVALPADSYDETSGEVGPLAFNAAAYEKANGFERDLSVLPTLPTTVKSVSAATLVLTLGSTKLDGSEYYGGNITVRVWIEGWDADTFDAIFERTLTVQMNFTEYVA